jgi:hypothetical protein
MFSVKFSAAIAAVLFMSAGAAQAGGRPYLASGMASSQATVVAMSMEHGGQFIHHIVRPTPIMKLASRHRPVSKPVAIRSAAKTFSERPYQPSLVSNPFTFVVVPIEIKFENRRGLVSNSFKALAIGDIRFADRLFTSSVSKVSPNSVEFCVGSIAPCGLGKFAQNQPVLTLRQRRISH